MFSSRLISSKPTASWASRRHVLASARSDKTFCGVKRRAAGCSYESSRGVHYLLHEYALRGPQEFRLIAASMCSFSYPFNEGLMNTGPNVSN